MATLPIDYANPSPEFAGWKNQKANLRIVTPLPDETEKPKPNNKTYDIFVGPSGLAKDHEVADLTPDEVLQISLSRVAVGAELRFDERGYPKGERAGIAFDGLLAATYEESDTLIVRQV